MNPDSEFELYSDRYVRKFSNYKINDGMMMTARENTPTINFLKLKSLLLSKDISRMTEYEALIAGENKFLDS
jgi:hypothetical protein